MDLDSSFRLEVKNRLFKLGMTQKELARRMGLTEPYLYYLLRKISDTKLARERRKRILEILDELEKESGCLIEK